MYQANKQTKEKLLFRSFLQGVIVATSFIKSVSSLFPNNIVLCDFKYLWECSYNRSKSILHSASNPKGSFKVKQKGHLFR